MLAVTEGASQGMASKKGKGKSGSLPRSGTEVDALERLLDLVAIGILSIESEGDGRVRANRHGADLLGQDGGSLSAGLRLFLDDRELPLDEQPLHRAAKSGQSVPRFEGHVVRADGSRIAVTMAATPLFDEAGKVKGGMATIIDISERQATEAQHQVLELQHRVKNVITTIGALATRMVKGSTSLEEFSQAFLGRLRAMAATHELLSSSNWTGTALRALVKSALQSHRGKNNAGISLGGPELMLTAGAASTLGLVLYELVTNASKYGSLSAADGHVDITWRTEAASEGEQVVLDWVERDGPPPTPPMSEGFGTSFIRRSVEYELAGTVSLQPWPKGLHCTIVFPLHANVQQRIEPG